MIIWMVVGVVALSGVLGLASVARRYTEVRRSGDDWLTEDGWTP